VVVPSNTAPEMMQAIEQRARGQQIRPDPAFLQANGLPPNHTISLDAKVMTQEQFFGLATVATGRTPLNYTRIDTNPGQLSAAEAKVWADRLKPGTPEMRDPTKLAAADAAYEKRRKEIKKLYDDVMSGKIEPPPGITRERLKLAVEGDPKTGERIPLTFPDAQTFHEFKAELQAALLRGGVTDATVQQVGSATLGWKGNPNKELGPWKPTSDADCAVFSVQALEQARAINAPVNKGKPGQPDTAPQLGGNYTVFKSGADVGGFYATPVGKELEALAKRWNTRLYGSATADGFDFKLNLDTKPFSSAITLTSP
jgi:hypothetical protein